MDYADPGYQADGKKRFAIEDAIAIRAAWHVINKQTTRAAYTEEQTRRIITRIIGAWKAKIAPAGPPTDADDLAALRAEVILAAKMDAPDPDDGETS